jgi:preprotein translocase subunit SecA
LPVVVQQALSAREYHHREKEYLVQDGKVVIVDEFTGRLLRLSGTTGERALRQAIGLAQSNAQQQAFNQRKAVLRSDQWIEELLGFAGSSIE